MDKHLSGLSLEAINPEPLEQAMKRTLKILSILIALSLVCLFPTQRIHAFPPLPSSFYGTVKLNEKDLPDGTLVEALIDDVIYGFTLSQTYEGSSVYSLDIPGDDPSTEMVEGGTTGDIIYFRVGGLIAEETGEWVSGSNINLELTIKSEEKLTTPQPTWTPQPTQTPISLFTPVSTNTTTAITEGDEISPIADPTPTATQGSQLAAELESDPNQDSGAGEDDLTYTESGQPGTGLGAENQSEYVDEERTSDTPLLTLGISQLVFWIGIPGVIVLGVLLALFLKKKKDSLLL